jgi:hypothetical protein
MIPHPPTHLSEEEFDDLLIELGSLQAQAHLQTCADCRRKLKSFQEDVHLFNEASMAWTEARALRPQTVPRRYHFFIPSPVLGICAAALLLLTIGLPVMFRTHHIGVSTSAISGTAETPDQIAKDNQLMKDVDAAINPDEAPVVDQYHLMESPKSR